MGLDFLTTPSYELDLPSSKKKIKYRPFVVKEEKLLLLAIQENKQITTFNAIRNLILACTHDVIDIKKVPIVDGEYLFLNIRNKSLGEGIELNVTCAKCEKKTTSEFNLENIEITGSTGDNKLTLDDALRVVMKYPTLGDSVPEFENSNDNEISLVANCIEFIEHNGDVYDATEYSEKERIEFVENLTQKQLRVIDDWLSEIPRVKFDSDVKCKHCGHVNQVRLVGLNDFFG